MHKKKRKMLPFVPSEDRVQRLVQMASAATALTASKMDFSNELTYVPSMAPKSSNQAKLEEGGMQVSKFQLKNGFIILDLLVPNNTLLDFSRFFQRRIKKP